MVVPSGITSFPDIFGFSSIKYLQQNKHQFPITKTLNYTEKKKKINPDFVKF